MLIASVIRKLNKKKTSRAGDMKWLFEMQYPVFLEPDPF